MTTGLEIIKLGWLSQTDWASLAFKAGNFIFVCLLIWLMIHFLLVKPRKFKFPLMILDVTGKGLIQYKDRGGWITDRISKSGEFQLMKDKFARLKMPPREAGIMSKRGKICFNFLKFGEGPYDYAVLDYTDVIENKTPEVIPLSDINWASQGVQRAMYKKNLGSFWAEHKSTLITLTAIVISMIIVGGAVQMAGDQAQTIASSTSEFVSKFDTIADKLEQVAVSLGGQSTPSSVPPPPPNTP